MNSQYLPPPGASGERQQDPELWFEDGNVMIIAGSAAFRVHAGVLSRHSEIFCDMFTIPQPALSTTASSDVDERPVVLVSDSAHDFKQLLHMLYYSMRFMPPDQPVSFSILAAVTRLGHKYHIEWILNEAKHRLRSIFAVSYEVWSNLNSQEHFWSHLVDMPDCPNPWLEAINIIQLIGATDMLPVAIYQCCQFPWAFFKGTRRVDGTMDTLGPLTLELCFNAYSALTQCQSRLTVETFCTGPSKLCQIRETCGGMVQDIHRIYVRTEPTTYPRGSLMDRSVTSGKGLVLRVGYVGPWLEAAGLGWDCLGNQTDSAGTSVWMALAAFGHPAYA